MQITWISVILVVEFFERLPEERNVNESTKSTAASRGH
jgi:hypothetical protein